MKNGHKSWLQLYVDAMTDRDPYKRLALVRELRRIPKEHESEEFLEGVIEKHMIRQSENHLPKPKAARHRKVRSGV